MHEDVQSKWIKDNCIIDPEVDAIQSILMDFK